jgi:hypothetical protein
MITRSLPFVNTSSSFFRELFINIKLLHAPIEIIIPVYNIKEKPMKNRIQYTKSPGNGERAWYTYRLHHSDGAYRIEAKIGQ